ncbi:ROK family protein, partial [Escherichia coli]
KQKWKAVVDKYRQEHEIVGIGVSFPGHINHHTGEAAKAGALDYLDGENLCELFAQLTDLPVTTENDANCAALGERWQGAGKDYE